jgi:hypothetical protein
MKTSGGTANAVFFKKALAMSLAIFKLKRPDCYSGIDFDSLKHHCERHHDQKILFSETVIR